MVNHKSDSRVSALFTDFYSLTMAQGYWKTGKNERAVFEMFFRRQPFGGGFSVFAGLETLIKRLKNFSYSEDDVGYLKSLGMFEDGFLEYLRQFKFTGTMWAFDEGSIIFPNEPIVRIDGGLIECQIIEGMLLNTINYQSLIATKAARVWLASGKGSVIDFGLRRAQGFDGAVSASRAAFIGGCFATSNVEAGRTFGIPVVGTMAHSWVMAFPGEEEAFRAYSKLYPNNSIFLIDTYDTLKNGIRNAVKVGGELTAAGKNFGVRLDSGDVHYLSVEARKILDSAGFKKATISVSNDLDEYIIQTLVAADAPIDVWGVGTQLITGGGEGAFTGVYKLAAHNCEGSHGEIKLRAAIKFSDNPEKTTNPGIKQVWRVRDADGMFVADILTMDYDNEQERIENGNTYTFWHPSADYRHFSHTVDGSADPLLKKKIENGMPLEESGTALENLTAIKKHLAREIDSLDQSYKRLLNPHIYKVSVSEKLRSLKLEMIKSHLK